MKEVSDAILGSMVRQILKDCPEFQVFKTSQDTRTIEVSSVYAADLVPDQMVKILRALERIATMHRQHIAGTDEFYNSNIDIR